VQIIGRQIHPHSEIVLGGTVLPVVDRHPGRWIVRIPEGARSGDLTVRTRWGEFRGPYFRVTEGRPAPIIESMVPTSGGPGTEVTLTGQNFAPRLADNQVRLGNIVCVVRSATPTQLVVVVPAGAANGSFVVSVANAGETQSPPFSVGAATTVTELVPRAGPPGSRIAIKGTGFSTRRANNRVFINNVPLRVVAATATQIDAVLPATAASGTILVDVVGGARAESPYPFVIQNMPTIAGFEPAAAAPGRTVAIRGANFGRDPRVVAVTVGGRAVVLRSVVPDRIEFVIPPGTPTGKIGVTVNGVGPALSATDLSVLVPVSLAGFEPRTGPRGTEVVVRGQGFAPRATDNEVYVGTVRVPVLRAATTELRIRVDTDRSGPIRVVVPNNGEVVSSVPFVVTNPPLVGSFAPTSGSEGTEVTISGRGFGTNASVVTVRLGTLQMPIRAISDDRIVAVVPAGAQTGPISVAVRLQGTGTSSTSFLVVSVFNATAVNPPSTFPGNRISITGQGFVPRTRVQFTGQRRPMPAHVVSPTELHVVVPPRVQSGPITVILPDRRTALTPPFTVATMPTGVAITAIEATCFRPGCRVVLRGHGFSPTRVMNRVYFGDAPVRVEQVGPGFLDVWLPAVTGTNKFKVDVRRVGIAESAPFTIVP
jgi:hypothetical protein